MQHKYCTLCVMKSRKYCTDVLYRKLLLRLLKAFFKKKYGFLKKKKKTNIVFFSQKYLHRRLVFLFERGNVFFSVHSSLKFAQLNKKMLYYVSHVLWNLAFFNSLLFNRAVILVGYHNTHNFKQMNYDFGRNRQSAII